MARPYEITFYWSLWKKRKIALWKNKIGKLNPRKDEWNNRESERNKVSFINCKVTLKTSNNNYRLTISPEGVFIKF